MTKRKSGKSGKGSGSGIPARYCSPVMVVRPIGVALARCRASNTIADWQ